MQWLASLLFTMFLFAWTGFYAVMFVVVGPLMAFRQRFVMARIWGGTLLAALKLICRLDYRVEGAENLPAGNHIALIKHSSAWETFGQVLLVPPHVWVLKRELVWVPFLGWALKLMRAIAIDRGAGKSAVQSVLEQGKQRLAEGEWIVIFPEGTRMPPGETRRYGVSGALLAIENERMIVPIAHDAGYYWPRRGLYKRPGTIRVVIGPPIPAAGREPREINEQAQAWIEAHSRH
ncbi:MAG: 1-acyl-sn-glycerol-3-phosphate acyltransferase [Proteobacteria bacterium]|nr:1-acyl-sn-glycerol-3-phosphate acyltransferase [Pseudomonadota bacterium]